MELRPAREDDIDALARLFIRARNQMDYLPPVPEEHVPEIASHIREHEELWLAEEDGRLLGFLAIEASRKLGGAAVLEKIYVEPTEQSRGVGTALLEKAKELRPDGLFLWVFQRNMSARRLYERHGFAVVRLTDGAENMEREPDALYAWRGS
jgi:GNAT superfamily N-acetyltransferase